MHSFISLWNSKTKTDFNKHSRCGERRNRLQAGTEVGVQREGSPEEPSQTHIRRWKLLGKDPGGRLQLHGSGLLWRVRPVHARIHQHSLQWSQSFGSKHQYLYLCYYYYIYGLQMHACIQRIIIIVTYFDMGGFLTCMGGSTAWVDLQQGWIPGMSGSPAWESQHGWIPNMGHGCIPNKGGFPAWVDPGMGIPTWVDSQHGWIPGMGGSSGVFRIS